jgi:hypothetical protein
MSGDTDGTPAIPFDIILASLKLFCLSGQGCKSLRGDRSFPCLEFWCQDIAFENDIAESRYNILASMNAITKTFGCQQSCVQAVLAHGLDRPGQRGKHIALDQDHEQQIRDWI